jgi:hypothetical protein
MGAPFGTLFGPKPPGFAMRFAVYIFEQLFVTFRGRFGTLFVLLSGWFWHACSNGMRDESKRSKAQKTSQNTGFWYKYCCPDGLDLSRKATFRSTSVEENRSDTSRDDVVMILS